MSHGILKFTEPVKAIYLAAIQAHGQSHLAAEEAGVSIRTVEDHRKKDPDFKEAELLAHKMRSQRIVRRIEQEAIEGILEPLFTKDGRPAMITGPDGKQVHAHRRRVETPLRKMVLARYDHEYRDVSEVLHKGAVGVMVMPAPVSTVGAWDALVASNKPAPKQLPESKEPKE